MSIEESKEHAPVLQAVIVTDRRLDHKAINTRRFNLEMHVLVVEGEKKKDDVLGRCMFPLQYVDRRLDHKAINTRRFNLKKHVLVVEGEKKKIINVRNLEDCDIELTPKHIDVVFLNCKDHMNKM
nr:FT-interacting protein 1-like [Tanacetum cinerariifolium]